MVKTFWIGLYILLNLCFCIAIEEVDCIVSEWSSWGSCSKNCSDEGTKTMNRTVIRPRGTLFGKECPKKMSHSMRCGTKNNGCQQFCDPLTGNCECKSGLILDKTSFKTCVDNNECALNFGRGPCNQKCINTDGSYYCSCNPSFYLAEDKHNCRFNSTSELCDLDIREYDNERKCICKDRSLVGLKCNKKKDKCKNPSCDGDSVCVLYGQSGTNCFLKENLIPILHPVLFDNYKEGDFNYIVELYIIEILENLKPKAPLFGDKPDHSFVKSDNPKYFYVEALNPQKIRTFTFVQYAVYNIEKSLREATRVEVCSRLSGTDVHCLTTKECNIIKSEGRSCHFIYDPTFGKQKNNASSNSAWIPITISLAILLLIIVAVIIFMRRRKVKWRNLQMFFNNRNEEVSYPDDSLLNRNEPPPPYCAEDSNLQHFNEFDTNVFKDEPLNKNHAEPVYESIPEHKLPGYKEYESMGCGKNKKCDMVELPVNDNEDDEPRYSSPSSQYYASNDQQGSSSSTSEPHYATRINNRPFDKDLTEVDHMI